MHKYTKLLQHLTYRQMKQLDFDQLEQRGITAEGPRNKLIRLFGDIDVDDLEKRLTPESNTPPFQRRSPAATAAPAAHVIVAQERSTPEGVQDGPSALVCDAIVTARTEAAPSNGTQAPLEPKGTRRPAAVAAVEAVTVCEDSTSEPPAVQTKFAAHSLHPQEDNAKTGHSSAGPSTLGLNATSSSKLKPTAAAFIPIASRRLHNHVVLLNFRHLHPKPQDRRFWNGWLWQKRLGYLAPPPDTSPEAFLPMEFPVPHTRGLAPPDGQQIASALHREEILDSESGIQGHRETTEEVDFEEDARNSELPEGMRELAASLIRMVDDFPAEQDP